jgi:hypothetical protein
MVGRNPLWIAKQHGHSITTMLRAYAAWAQDAVEADIEAIQHAMDFSPRAIKPAALSEARSPQAAVRSVVEQPSSAVETARHDHLGSGFANSDTGGERGTRTRRGGLSNRSMYW